jgi:hypothetical protein
MRRVGCDASSGEGHALSLARLNRTSLCLPLSELMFDVEERSGGGCIKGRRREKVRAHLLERDWLFPLSLYPLFSQQITVGI